MTPSAENEIPDLIAKLGDENGLVRQRARFSLIHLGAASIPAAVNALKSSDMHTRWEAVKVLRELRNPEAAAPLANMLLDDDTGVRWSAMEGLINLERAALRPLLELFTKKFDSPIVREGLHHILHVFKDRGLLNEKELALFKKLDKMEIGGFLTTWDSDAAWTAEKALEALILEDKK